METLLAKFDKYWEIAAENLKSAKKVEVLNVLGEFSTEDFLKGLHTTKKLVYVSNKLNKFTLPEKMLILASSRQDRVRIGKLLANLLAHEALKDKVLDTSQLVLVENIKHKIPYKYSIGEDIEGYELAVSLRQQLMKAKYRQKDSLRLELALVELKYNLFNTAIASNRLLAAIPIIGGELKFYTDKLIPVKFGRITGILPSNLLSELSNLSIEELSKEISIDGHPYKLEITNLYPSDYIIKGDNMVNIKTLEFVSIIPTTDTIDLPKAVVDILKGYEKHKK